MSNDYKRPYFPIGRPTIEEALGPIPQERVPAPKPKKRRNKKNRAFTYRGFTFYTHTENGVSKIYSLNPSSKQMEHQATVPSEAVMTACRELAKMGIAWQILEDLSSKSKQGTS